MIFVPMEYLANKYEDYIIVMDKMPDGSHIVLQLSGSVPFGVGWVSDRMVSCGRGGTRCEVKGGGRQVGELTGDAGGEGDQVLPGLPADAWLADKAYDADERVLAVRAAAEVTAVIPPTCNRVVPREYSPRIY